MAFPRNEAETIALYKLCQCRLGWRIAHLQTAFPDAIIEDRQGRQLVAEFEFKSRNFKAHKHDPAGCDIIIAYENNWKNPPVPVWTLKRYAKEETRIIRQLLRGKIQIDELVKEQQRCISLQSELSELNMKLIDMEQESSLGQLKHEYQLKCADIKRRHEIELAKAEAETDWIIPAGYAILGMSFIMMIPAAISLIEYLIQNGIGG